MSYQHTNPFAALSKKAFLSGVGDMASGLYNNAAGAVNNAASKATSGFTNTLQAMGGASAGGSYDDSLRAAQRASGNYQNQQTTRAVGGNNLAGGVASGMLERAATPWRATQALAEAGSTLAGGGSAGDAAGAYMRNVDQANNIIGAANQRATSGRQTLASLGAPLSLPTPQKPYVAQGPPAPGLASIAPAPNQGGAPPTTPSIAAPPRARIVNSNLSPGLTVAHQDQFRKMHGGAYDPNSSVDRQKMQGITKTAFAMLEKEATGGLAGLLSKGVSGVGKILSRGSNAAKRTAMNASLRGNGFASAAEARMSGLSPNIISGALDDAKAAVKNTGNSRRGAGKALASGAGRIEDSKGIQNAINYGTGTIAGGGTLYGAHSLGHNSGRESGVLEGTEKGMELGMQGAQATQPGDPGFMGRLADLFTGTQAGPDTAAMRQGLSADRDKLVKAILEG